MPIRRALALFVLLAAPAGAQAPITIEEFEALAEGRTLYFSAQGLAFGAEQYFPGRRSIWQFRDGSCEAGVWWPVGEAICFRYEGEDIVQCWRFLPREDGLAAAAVGDGGEDGLVLELERSDTVPLACDDVVS